MSAILTPTIQAATMSTPIGPLTLLVATVRSCAGGFTDDVGHARALPPKEAPRAAMETVDDLGPITEALAAYFEGEVAALDGIPVSVQGGPFQERVWAALRQIRPGSRTTYRDLAVKLGGAAAGPGGRDGLRHQPDRADRAVPSGDRQRRQADRLLLGPRAQALAPGPRAGTPSRGGRSGRQGSVRRVASDGYHWRRRPRAATTLRFWGRHMTESSAQTPIFSFGDRLLADPATRERRALVTRVMQASLAAVEPGEAVRRALRRDGDAPDRRRPLVRPRRLRARDRGRGRQGERADGRCRRGDPRRARRGRAGRRQARPHPPDPVGPASRGLAPDPRRVVRQRHRRAGRAARDDRAARPGDRGALGRRLGADAAAGRRDQPGRHAADDRPAAAGRRDDQRDEHDPQAPRAGEGRRAGAAGRAGRRAGAGALRRGRQPARRDRLRPDRARHQHVRRRLRGPRALRDLGRLPAQRRGAPARPAATGKIADTPKPGDPLFDRVQTVVVAATRWRPRPACARPRARGSQRCC